MDLNTKIQILFFITIENNQANNKLAYMYEPLKKKLLLILKYYSYEIMISYLVNIKYLNLKINSIYSLVVYFWASILRLHEIILLKK